MLTKLVELLSCTICFLGIIAFNYFQVVQSINLLVVYSLGHQMGACSIIPPPVRGDDQQYGRLDRTEFGPRDSTV